MPDRRKPSPRRFQQRILIGSAVLVFTVVCGACTVPEQGELVPPVERPALAPEDQARLGKLLMDFPNRLDATKRVDRGNQVIWELVHSFPTEAVPWVLAKLESGDAAAKAYAAYFFLEAPTDKAVAALTKALEDSDPLVVRLAYAALGEYYFEPDPATSISGYSPGSEPLGPHEREWRMENADKWNQQFKGQTRRQVLLAVLAKDERDVHALDCVPKLLPRDEAIDYLIAWALSDKVMRVWAMHTLKRMTGLEAFGGRTPDERSTASARTFWKWVGSLSPQDRSVLIAIGRLLTSKSYGTSKSDLMSESEARRIFLDDEKQSLRVWRRLYEWEDVCGHTPRGHSGASRRLAFLTALAKVNSPRCLAVVKRAREEHRGDWLGDAAANLLHNLEADPRLVMEEPPSTGLTQHAE